jgi:ABC-type nitrate/sulfonate/bicarbonate transport system permease component
MSSYFLVFIGAFFPIFTNTYAGVHNVDPLHTMVAYSYQLTKAEFLRKVVLPSALPSIFS